MIEGIVTLTHRIVRNAVSVDVPEEVAQVPGGRDVNTSNRCRQRGSNRRIRRRIGNRLHALLLQRCERREIAARRRAERAEESSINLIADRHHVRHDTCGTIGLHFRLHVVVEVGLGLRQRIAGPRTRNRSRRTSVEQQREFDGHSQLFGALRQIQIDGIGLRITAVTRAGRRNPAASVQRERVIRRRRGGTDAYHIHAMILENQQKILCLPRILPPRNTGGYALLLLLFQERVVDAAKEDRPQQPLLTLRRRARCRGLIERRTGRR